MIPTRDVPCNGCLACCRRETVILHPECGDDPAQYLTSPTRHPMTGQTVFALQHKENGDCHYLGPHGCSIWERRPSICREFDCRLSLLRFKKSTRKAMIAKGLMDQAVVDAGRARLDTLSIAERANAVSRQRI